MICIYYNSCSRRVAASLSCCSHFNYLECWKILSLQSKSSFCGALCKWTETHTKDLKTDLSSSSSIFSFRVWTTIFWHSVLEIITTQNINFWCEGEKGKRKTRWHTRRARVRNAMRSWFEYRWTRNREFIRNEQIFLQLSMKTFLREPIYRLSNLIVSFYQNSQKRWMSINKLKSESRHKNIHY
jgi:hypothetical protein